MPLTKSRKMLNTANGFFAALGHLGFDDITVGEGAGHAALESDFAAAWSDWTTNFHPDEARKNLPPIGDSVGLFDLVHRAEKSKDRIVFEYEIRERDGQSFEEFLHAQSDGIGFNDWVRLARIFVKQRQS